MTTHLAMSEADLQDAVIDLARLLGYRVAHFRPARVGTGDNQRWVTPVAADGKGFPDLVLVGRGRVVFAELKSADGRLAPDQKGWLDAIADTVMLGMAIVDVHVWRPSHWHDGTIEHELRA